MYCIVLKLSISLFYQSKKTTTIKNNFMRKFLFTVQFFAIIAFVPAITYAYLHNDAPKENNTVKVENTNDMSGQHQTTGVIRLINGL